MINNLNFKLDPILGHIRQVKVVDLIQKMKDI